MAMKPRMKPRLSVGERIRRGLYYTSKPSAGVAAAYDAHTSIEEGTFPAPAAQAIRRVWATNADMRTRPRVGNFTESVDPLAYGRTPGRPDARVRVDRQTMLRQSSGLASFAQMTGGAAYSQRQPNLALPAANWSPRSAQAVNWLTTGQQQVGVGITPRRSITDVIRKLNPTEGSSIERPSPARKPSIEYAAPTRSMATSPELGGRRLGNDNTLTASGGQGGPLSSIAGYRDAIARAGVNINDRRAVMRENRQKAAQPRVTESAKPYTPSKEYAEPTATLGTSPELGGRRPGQNLSAAIRASGAQAPSRTGAGTGFGPYGSNFRTLVDAIDDSRKGAASPKSAAFAPRKVQTVPITGGGRVNAADVRQRGGEDMGLSGTIADARGVPRPETARAGATVRGGVGGGRSSGTLGGAGRTSRQGDEMTGGRYSAPGPAYENVGSSSYEKARAATSRAYGSAKAEQLLRNTAAAPPNQYVNGAPRAYSGKLTDAQRIEMSRMSGRPYTSDLQKEVAADIAAANAAAGRPVATPSAPVQRGKPKTLSRHVTGTKAQQERAKKSGRISGAAGTGRIVGRAGTSSIGVSGAASRARGDKGSRKKNYESNR